MGSKNNHVCVILFIFVSQVRHGAGTGLREILKSHGAEGGKVVGSTAEQVGLNHIFRLFLTAE